MQSLVGDVDVLVLVQDDVDRPGVLTVVLTVSADTHEVVGQPLCVVEVPHPDDRSAVVAAQDIDAALVADGDVVGEVGYSAHSECLQEWITGSKESVGSAHDFHLYCLLQLAAASLKLCSLEANFRQMNFDCWLALLRLPFLVGSSMYR